MKIKLEKFNLNFAEALAEAVNHKEVQNNLNDGLPFPYTVYDAINFINYALSVNGENEFIFAITLNGRCIGCISATRQNNVHRYTAEIGYYISPEFWGKGFATQAVKLICKHVFENTDIIRIYAQPFARNAASCRVLKKSGFTDEGTLRKNAVKCGVTEDTKIYSLIK